MNGDPDEWRIVAAAVRHNATGLVFTMSRPARHHDILHRMSGLGLSVRHDETEQGFVTNEGDFVRRPSALSIAHRARQLLPRYNGCSILTSEDVW